MRGWNTFISSSVVQDACKPQHTESTKPKVTLGRTPPLDNSLPLLLLYTSFAHTSYHTHTHTQGGRATSCYTTDRRAPYMHNTAEPWQHGNPRQKSNMIYLHLSMGVTCLKCCSAQIYYKHGSYMLNRCTNTWRVYTVHIWTLPLKNVLYYSTLNITRSKYTRE